MSIGMPRACGRGKSYRRFFAVPLVYWQTARCFAMLIFSLENPKHKRME